MNRNRCFDPNKPVLDDTSRVDKGTREKRLYSGAEWRDTINHRFINPFSCEYLRKVGTPWTEYLFTFDTYIRVTIEYKFEPFVYLVLLKIFKISLGAPRAKYRGRKKKTKFMECKVLKIQREPLRKRCLAAQKFDTKKVTGISKRDIHCSVYVVDSVGS